MIKWINFIIYVTSCKYGIQYINFTIYIELNLFKLPQTFSNRITVEENLYFR